MGKTGLLAWELLGLAPPASLGKHGKALWSIMGQANNILLRTLLLVLPLHLACGPPADAPEPPEPGPAPVCGNGVLEADEACDDGNDVDDDACRNDCLEPPPEFLGGHRPTPVHYPEGYDPAEPDQPYPFPLMILLHGHGQNASLIEQQLGGLANQQELGYLLLIPEGTVAEDGRQFWNATDACCNFHGSEVDDLGYLRGLIDEALEKLHADPQRVYVMGLSNGGFMAERMACDAADKVTGVVNVSGSGFLDPERCQPSRSVAYLRVHSTIDTVIPYEGGRNMPGAAECVARWRQHNHCQGDGEERREDLDGEVPGEETSHRRWRDCDPGAGVHFLSMEGAGHVPRFTPASRRSLMAQVMDYFRP